MLLNANPEATKVKDNNGMLPLHVAILYNAPHTVVTTLLEKYPQALKVGKHL
jgi:ankyrin repeat protein